MEFESQFHPERFIGCEVRTFAELSSTNDYVLETPGLKPGTIVVARQQSAGRGTHGRSWWSEPDHALLVTIALPTTTNVLARPVIITAWVAVALAEAIRLHTNLQARIKWPNDLLILGKKVSGILIEQRQTIAVGVGVNLQQPREAFDAAKLPDATSLQTELQGTTLGVSRDAFLEAFIVQLELGYQHLVAGERIALESEWAWRVGLLGRAVWLEHTDGRRIEGRLRAMGFDGVELQRESDEDVLIPPEQIRHLGQL